MSSEPPTNGNGEQQALAKVQKGSLRWYLENAESPYNARLQQLLGQRAPQFCASLISLVNSSSQFDKVRPQSIISAGVVAATLDLPVDRNLGFAWIIPYGELAQFQIGYKGFVQLALRSGRYAGMNAVTVNAEALGGYDEIGDPLIKWDQLDETKEAVGYAFAWRLTSGFTKIVYWPKHKVEAHAQRYSQAYKKGKKDSPWVTHFDQMALKTLIQMSLKKWGIMSVEDRALQVAFTRDQSAAIDVEATPIYPDADTETPASEPEPPPAGLSDLTDKLNNATVAPVEATVSVLAVEPPPPVAETLPPLSLVTEVKKAAEPMTIEQMQERLAKAPFVADVRALKILWCGPKVEMSDSQREQITKLCDARIEEIKRAGTAQKG